MSKILDFDFGELCAARQAANNGKYEVAVFPKGKVERRRSDAMYPDGTVFENAAYHRDGPLDISEEAADIVNILKIHVDKWIRLGVMAPDAANFVAGIFTNVEDIMTRVYALSRVLPPEATADEYPVHRILPPTPETGEAA